MCVFTLCIIKDERIEWMEAILPGSSASLVRFSKSGSLHRATPLSPQNSLPYNPYSLAEQNPNVGNGSPQSSVPVGSSWQEMATGVQPLNYMEPVTSVQHREQKNHPVGAQREVEISEGTQSECGRKSPQVVVPPSRLSASADTKPSADSSTKSSKAKFGDGTRQATNRSTISHLEREKERPVVQLSRSNTDRVSTKSPEVHLYELDSFNLEPPSSKPPVLDRAPPVPKPRAKKNPPPRLKDHAESLSDSQTHDSPEPRYATRPQSQTGFACKEAEFDYPAELSPRGQTRQVNSGTTQVQRPESNKPPVTPRRAKPVKQPEYLSLSSGDTDSGSGQNSSSEHNALSSLSVSGISGLSEDVVKNFTPNQVDELIKMLQQVQSNDSQQPTPIRPHPGATRDLMRRNFGRYIQRCHLKCTEYYCFSFQKEQSAIHLSLELIKCKSIV